MTEIQYDIIIKIQKLLNQIPNSGIYIDLDDGTKIGEIYLIQSNNERIEYLGKGNINFEERKN